MLAEAVEIDVSNNDHLVVIDVEECSGQCLSRILRIALRKETHRLRDTSRRFDEPVTSWVFA